MNATHTPGPWEVVKHAPGSSEPAVMASGYFIATVHGLGNSGAETFANARLIAAAPDLLAALKGCRDMLWAMANSKGVAFECLGPAHEAIAKAEGKES